MMNLPLPSRVNIDAVAANSFKDFHTKGLDYLCLKRSPTETLKLYFFDGDITKLPEVINPHDHRYDFDTWVVCGASENVWYSERRERSGRGTRFHTFEYMTPLNGGDGFKFVGHTHLGETDRQRYRRGGMYRMFADELHTIRIIENETVLMLRQFEDVVPIDTPTYTYTRSEEAPKLDGLYNRFTADQVIEKLKNFEERTGVRFEATA